MLIEYAQHMFLLRNKKNNFPLRSLKWNIKTEIPVKRYVCTQDLECVTEKYFSYFSTKTYVVFTQKNRLNETVLLSTKNICWKLWVRKYLQFFAENFCIPKPEVLRNCFFFIQSLVQPISNNCTFSRIMGGKSKFPKPRNSNLISCIIYSQT